MYLLFENDTIHTQDGSTLGRGVVFSFRFLFYVEWRSCSITNQYAIHNRFEVLQDRILIQTSIHNYNVLFFFFLL